VECLAFFLYNDWFKHFSATGKIPLYALLGMSFAFTITYSFSELVALAPWDKFCGTDGTVNPVFRTPAQIFSLFGVSIFMGSLFGLLFGLVDVESDGPNHDKLKQNTLYSIPIGVSVGAIFGAINEWYRNRLSEAEATPIYRASTDTNEHL